MVRYNTIRNLGPIEPRDRSAEVLNQSFATGMRLAQSAQYMRMQKIRMEEAKENQRKQHLYALTKDLPQGFDFGLLHDSERKGAEEWLLNKKNEYGQLANQIAEGKLDPTSEEFFAINNQMGNIKNAITNYENQMKEISAYKTKITDATNPNVKGGDRLAEVPDNDLVQDFFTRKNLEEGYIQRIDEGGNVLYFEPAVDDNGEVMVDELGQPVLNPLMYNGKQIGSGNLPKGIFQNKDIHTAMYNNDLEFLNNFEKNGEATEMETSKWTEALRLQLDGMSHDELKAQVMDGHGKYQGLITKSMLKGIDDPETEENEGFYDKNKDGIFNEGDMRWNDLYNDHDALKQWYTEQKTNVVTNEATRLTKEWDKKNPPAGAELETLGDPEYYVQNIFNQTSSFNDTMLAPVNAVKKDLLEEYSKTSRTSADYADYVKKVNDLHKINQTARKTAHYLNSQLGYNTGTSMIYSSDDAYNQYKNTVNDAIAAWEEEGKLYPEGSSKPKQTVDGKSYEVYITEKPDVALSKSEWAKAYIGYDINENSLIFVNPSTQPGIPTSYTPIPELDGWDNMTNNEKQTRYIARRSNIRFNEKAVQQHRLFGGGPDKNL